MTPQNLRIAMAELDGWEWHGDAAWSKTGDANYWKKDMLVYCQLPDYPSDLNAVHELEKKLIPRLKLDLNRDFSKTNAEIYSNMLMRIIQDRRCIKSAVEARYTTASAEATERCEALARLHGKWEEDK